MESITIIAATHRPGSMSRRLADQYLTFWEDAGGKGCVLGLETLPEGFPAGDLFGKRTSHFLPFQQRMETSQKMVFIVPEYNGGMPGMLKLFIDALDYPTTLAGKKIALVGLSAGAGGCQKGLQHLQEVMDYLKALVFSERVHIAKIRDKVNEFRNLRDPESLAAIRSQIQGFSEF